MKQYSQLMGVGAKHWQRMRRPYLVLILLFLSSGAGDTGLGQNQQSSSCPPTQSNTFCNFTLYDLPILPGPVNSGPAWSPDGKQIAFAF